MFLWVYSWDSLQCTEAIYLFFKSAAEIEKNENMVIFHFCMLSRNQHLHHHGGLCTAFVSFLCRFRPLATQINMRREGLLQMELAKMG